MQTTMAPGTGRDVWAREGGDVSKPVHRRVIAGTLLAATGIGMVMSIITNEALFPAERHYDTFTNSISDLSGTLPPNSYTVEPNRTIFIVTMAACGIMVLASACLLWSALQRRRVVVGLAVFGVGLVGIAVFPGDAGAAHQMFSMVCFVGGSITALLSRKVLTRPASVFAAALGIVALAATVLGQQALESWGPQAAIGVGGIERWIAYPVLLWLVMFGSTLMADRRPR